MANGPPSEIPPPWLKPLVAPLTVGRHFSTRPGAALPHVGALPTCVDIVPPNWRVKKLPLRRWDELFTIRMTDYSICSSILHSPKWRSWSCE